MVQAKPIWILSVSADNCRIVNGDLDERAARIAGKVSLVSSETYGTELTAVVPPRHRLPGGPAILVLIV